MTYLELEKELIEKKNDKKAAFDKPLFACDLLCLGWPIPELRKLGNTLAKEDSILLDDFKLDTYFEVNFLYFVIALKRLKNLEKQTDFLLQNKDHLHTWAITDTIDKFIQHKPFLEAKPYLLKMQKGGHYLTRL